MILAALAAVIGFCVVDLISTSLGEPFPVPWLAAATLFILALALFIWALLIRPRLMRKPDTKPISPFVAARTVALAMAASRTGALVGGFYLGVALELASRFENDYARARIWAALAAVVGALLVVLAALWLEYICRLPDGGDEDSPHRDGTEDTEEWVLPTNRVVDAPRTVILAVRSTCVQR